MKLCLIGSTRFRDQFIEMNVKLSKMGHIVYTVATSKEEETLSEAEKEILDLVHLRKIEESEGVVLITDEDGYLGDSTRREMAWAMLRGLPVFDGRTYRGESSDSINLRVHELVMETKSIDRALEIRSMERRAQRAAENSAYSRARGDEDRRSDEDLN